MVLLNRPLCSKGITDLGYATGKLVFFATGTLPEYWMRELNETGLV